MARRALNYTESICLMNTREMLVERIKVVNLLDIQDIQDTVDIVEILF